MLTAILIIVTLALVGFYLHVRQREAKSDGGTTVDHAQRKAADSIPKIRGNGRFSVEVVGESFYRDNLRALFPIRREDDDDERDAIAELRLEDDNAHDDKAVGVYIQDRKVGHLSRAMARDFRQAIQRDRIDRWKNFLVAACVWVPDDPEEDHSVTLDLPEQ